MKRLGEYTLVITSSSTTNCSIDYAAIALFGTITYSSRADSVAQLPDHWAINSVIGSISTAAMQPYMYYS